MSVAPPPTLFAVEREARWRIWALFGLLLLVIWIALLPISLAAVGLVLSYSLDVQRPDGATTSHPVTLSTTGTIAATALLALGLALLVAGTAWVVSRRNARERLLKTLRAQPLDLNDSYHRRLANVVDELRVAAGLPALDCVTVPGLAMNAFSFSSGGDPGCIGVTEGALSRLSRPQLQGVVAHELAHIASRDCVTATRACLLFLGVSRVEEAYREGPLGGAAFTALLLNPLGMMLALQMLWIYLMRLAAGVVNQAISRQREFAADLASARFTRDPVSLAEALEMMGQHRGSAAPLPARLSLLFFGPTQAQGIEAGGGWLSSHPPLTARIDHLLSLARAQSADDGERAAQIAQRQRSREHVALPPGARTRTIEDLADQAVVTDSGCPVCGHALRRVAYEGTSILACPECGGRAVTFAQVEAVLARREMGFTPEEERLADLLEEERRLHADLFQGAFKAPRKGQKSPLTQPKAVPIACPGCGTEMGRGAWSVFYPVAIDRCGECGLVWFDRDELEVLQILVERQTS